MKRIILILTGFLLVTACTPQPTPPTRTALSIRPAIESLSLPTKVNDAGFQDSDSVGLYVVSYQTSQTAPSLQDGGNLADNKPYVYNALSNTWNVAVGQDDVYWEDQNTRFDIYGYYPHNITVTDVSQIPFSVSLDQTSPEDYYNSDLLRAAVQAQAPQTEPVSLAFRHMMSQTVITLDPGMGYTAQEFLALEKTMEIEGVYSAALLDLSTGVLTPSVNGTLQTILPYQSGNTFTFIVVPQANLEEAPVMRLTVDGEVYTYLLERTFEANRTWSLDIILNKGLDLQVTGNTISEWTEITILGELTPPRPTDLAPVATANCYIVPSAGYYAFPATIIGNGNDGIIADAGFHTTTATIAPVSVDILWQDSPGLIADDISIEDGKVVFTAAEGKGNALIAVRDANNTILWSWHLWLTDTPADQTYKNNNLVVMDRNLGATSTAYTASRKEVLGMYYQWGRKDPFRYDVEPTKVETSQTLGTIANTIATPTTFYTSETASTTYMTYDWYYGSNQYLWGNPFIAPVNGIQPLPQKTIYDPCPAGYCMGPSDQFLFFSANDFTYYDYGALLAVNDTQTSWWPFGGTRWYDDGLLDAYRNTHGFYWLSVPLYMTLSSQLAVEYTNATGTAQGNLVRCVKDQERVATTAQVNTLTATAVTATSAILQGEVPGSNGGSAITRFGFEWGTSASSLVNVSAYSGSGMGAYSYRISGLVTGTTYYYRSFVTNGIGTTYGQTRSFRTTSSSEPLWFFQPFARKSLAMVWTGTWCPYATTMDEQLEGAMLADPGNIVPLYLFDADSEAGISLPTAEQALGNYYGGIIGYPTLIMDGRASIDPLSSAIVDLASEARALLPSVTALNLSVEVDQGSVFVTGKLFSKEPGTFLLGLALVEDNVVARQSGTDGEYIESYVHNHVARAFLTAMPGNEITFASYGSVALDYSLALPATVDDMAQCHIVAYVMKPASGHSGDIYYATYLTSNPTYVDNCVVVPLGQSVVTVTE